MTNEWLADWAPSGRRILFAPITGLWSDTRANVMIDRGLGCVQSARRSVSELELGDKSIVSGDREGLAWSE